MVPRSGTERRFKWGGLTSDPALSGFTGDGAMDTMCESDVHCTRRGVLTPDEPLPAVLTVSGLWVEGRDAPVEVCEPAGSEGECVFDGLREPPAEAVPNGSSGIDIS